MNIDSTSFTKIKQMTTFAYADLRRITLSDVDLSGIDLEAADLSYSDFSKVNMSNGNLKRVRMESVLLVNSKLNKSEIVTQLSVENTNHLKSKDILKVNYNINSSTNLVKNPNISKIVKNKDIPNDTSHIIPVKQNNTINDIVGKAI